MNWQALLALLTCFPTVSNGANILAILSSPSYSHQVFYRVYLKALHDRGHNITVATTDPIRDPTLKNYREIDMSYSYRELKNLFDVNSKGGSNSIAVKEIMFLVFGVIIHKLCHVMLTDPNIMDMYRRNETFDLFVAEWGTFTCVFPFERLAGGRMIGITSFELGALSHANLGGAWSPAFAPDVSLGYTDKLTFLQRLRATIFNWNAHLIFKYIRHEEANIARKYFGEDIEHPVDVERKVSLVFDNSHVTMGYPRPNNVNLIPLGGPAFHLHGRKPQKLPKIPNGNYVTKQKTEDCDIKDFLDDAPNGVIYFSLGTNVKTNNMSENVEKILMESFGRIKQKVLWKWENEKLKVNLKNVKVGKWFPQVDVLAHPNVKAFVTQAGLQSIGEALEYKIPLITIPFFADQNHNARKMEVEGVAIRLVFDELNADMFTRALNEIVNNKKYKENMIRFSALVRDQPIPPVEKAVWWTEYVLRHNGAPHLRSAAATMPWYQYHGLDVLGVIFLALFIIIYIIYTILRFAFRCSTKAKKD